MAVALKETCYDCGLELTDEEAHYYLYRCEGCEEAHHIRIIRWQNGAPDPQLDAMYQNQPRAIH